mmetsp:Transcript_3664/g.8689  ORF Transcript_3664/g.8689 Transcript_3664/m.8689 type:complete len:253 (-) Transcript_3664:306-1064(-)
MRSLVHAPLPIGEEDADLIPAELRPRSVLELGRCESVGVRIVREIQACTAGLDCFHRKHVRALLLRVRELDGRELGVGEALLLHGDERREIEALECLLGEPLPHAVHGGVNDLRSRGLIFLREATHARRDSAEVELECLFCRIQAECVASDSIGIIRGPGLEVLVDSGLDIAVVRGDDLAPCAPIDFEAVVLLWVVGRRHDNPRIHAEVFHEERDERRRGEASHQVSFDPSLDTDAGGILREALGAKIQRLE